MAEAVGLAASIITLAEISFRVLQYLHAIKNKDRAKEKLNTELMSVCLLLQQLKVQIGEEVDDSEPKPAWQQALSVLDKPGGLFERLRNELNDLERKLTSSSSRFGKAMVSLSWPLTEKQALAIVTRIAGLKADITLAVTQSNHAINKELLSDMSAVKSQAQENQLSAILAWLSPLNFRQMQKEVFERAITGQWFADNSSFSAWHKESRVRMLWYYGMPGAGKSFHAALAFDELAQTYASASVGVFIAFSKFDIDESQTERGIVASLLKQIFSSQGRIPEKLQELFAASKRDDKSPPAVDQMRQILHDELGHFERCFVILDGLDEVKDDHSRRRLLDTLHSLPEHVKLLVTSRMLPDIDESLPATRPQIHCCKCSSTDIAKHWRCQQCPRFAVCLDCYTNGVICTRDRHEMTLASTCKRHRFVPSRGDIEKYIQKRINDDSDLKRFAKEDSDLGDDIIGEVLDFSQDIFLLARLHMDSLVDSVIMGLSGVRRALQELEPDISEACGKTIERTKKQLSKTRWMAVENLLAWIVLSRRLLTVTELGHAMAVTGTPVSHTIDQDSIPPIRSIASWCGGLVYIDNNDWIYLIHPTIQRYFLDRIEELFGDRHKTIAMACLSYMSLDELKTPCEGPNRMALLKLRNQRYPFLGYAAQNWGYHMRQSSTDDMNYQALALLESEKANNAISQILFDMESTFVTEKKVSALHLAAHFGLISIASTLVEAGEDLNALDGVGATPMMYSVIHGYVDMVDKFLAMGALPNVVCNYGSTALTRALRAGKIEVAKRLLKEGDIAVNATDRTDSVWNCYGTVYNAVKLAIHHNYESILDLLLAREDIDLGPYEDHDLGRTALLYACNYQSRPATVAKILKIRSDLLETIGHGSESHTPLLRASTYGANESILLLLEAGANIHQRDNMGGTAIMRAVDSGYLETARLLIQHGARIDVQDVFNRTILHAAAINARHSVLAYLLETYEDIDVNIQDRDGVTPLHDAVARASQLTVAILVGANARCNIPDKPGRTAVDRAIARGDDNILRTLSRAPGFYDHKNTPPMQKSLIVGIESETDEDLKVRIAQTSPDELNEQGTIWDGTPLHRACVCGRPSVIRMLVDAGAKLDLQDSLGRTPLLMAFSHGHIDAAATLIALGAEINKSNGERLTPWEDAIAKGSIQRAMLLIEAGADIPHNSTYSSSALHYAIDRGRINAIKKLLERGVSTEHKFEGLSVWQRAAKIDNEAITDILDEHFKMKRAESMKLLAAKKLQTPEDSAQDPDQAATPRNGLLNVAPSWRNDFITRAFKTCKTPSFAVGFLVALLSVMAFVFIEFIH